MQKRTIYHTHKPLFPYHFAGDSSGISKAFQIVGRRGRLYNYTEEISSGVRNNVPFVNRPHHGYREKGVHGAES
jgi:hypothetical protein